MRGLRAPTRRASHPTMSLLATQDLTVRFGGHVAVNGVTCAFQPGTLTAIVGPNGAGKTTFFNLISGQLKATAGRVTLDGRDLSGLSASGRTRAGLGRAFQLTNLFPRLTVLENVRLAVQASADGDAPARPEPVEHLERPPRADGARGGDPARCGHVRQERRTGGEPAAWRPAQAGSRPADGAAGSGVHVRRAHCGHERGRGAGDPEPDPQTQGRPQQDHPAGGTQDGRRARAGRSHHRAAQRHPGRRWGAGRGHRIADRAGSLSGGFSRAGAPEHPQGGE